MKNIVLVVLDTVAAAHLPFHGYDRETAPFLSHLVEKNLLFEQAYANAPWTLPSHASIFSGNLPSEHGSTTRNIDFSERSLTEELSEQGYSTCGIVNNIIAATTGFDRGFDTFFGAEEVQFAYRDLPAMRQVRENDRKEVYSSRREKYADFLVRVVKERDVHSLVEGVKHLNRKRRDEAYSYAFVQDSGASATNALAEETISEGNEPFFLFVNYMEAHEPYDPPNVIAEQWMEAVDKTKRQYSELERLGSPENIGIDIDEELVNGIRTLYDAEIRYLDRKIEELYHTLNERFSDTLFIITSDHGENLGHHGMWAHQYGIWERLLHVPLIIAGDDINADVIDSPVSLRNLYDFILGEQERSSLTEEVVFAEYHGAAHYIFGEEDVGGYDHSDVLKNTSRAAIDKEAGFVVNSHLDSVTFGPKDSEEMYKKLQKAVEERFNCEIGGVDI